MLALGEQASLGPFLLTGLMRPPYVSRPLRVAGGTHGEKDTALADVKVTKKDIQEARRPDAVLEGATSLFDWLIDHKNAVIGGIVALLLLVGGISVAQNMKQRQFSDTGGKLSSALELTSRPVDPSSAQGDAAAKSDAFASKADQTKAFQEALTNVAKDHADSAAAKSASLVLAAQRYNEGKYDEAVSLAETYTKSDDGSLRALAYETLGNAYAAKNDAAKAEDAYKKVADAGAPAQSAFLLAGLQEKAGKKEEARKAYEKIIADYEKDDAGIAREARSRLDLLDMPAPGQGALEAPAAPSEAPAGAAKNAPKKASAAQAKSDGK